MTKDVLIAEQQLTIRDLEKTVQEMYDTIQQVYNSLYCIGAPLNDNCIDLNNEQLHYFATNIGNPVRDIIENEELHYKYGYK